NVTAAELAGEPIRAKLTKALGNGAAIGGLKVVAESGWFAARPSGTENVDKVYAESFPGPDHLERIGAEAQPIVAASLAEGGRWRQPAALRGGPHVSASGVTSRPACRAGRTGRRTRPPSARSAPPARSRARARNWRWCGGARPRPVRRPPGAGRSSSATASGPPAGRSPRPGTAPAGASPPPSP